MDLYDIKEFTKSSTATEAAIPPLSPDTVDALTTLIELEGESVGGAVTDRLHTGTSKAAKARDRARAKADAHRPKADASALAAQVALVGSLFTGVVALLLFFGLIPAEYSLNATVLPWVVGIEPDSMTGLALSLGPTLMTIGLDLLLVHVFKLDALDDESSAPQQPSGWARWLWHRLPVIASGALTILAIFALSNMRGRVVEMRTGDGTTPLDPTFPLLLFALALSLITAIAYVIATTHLRRCWHRRQLRREAAHDASVQHGLDDEAAAADAEAERAERLSNDSARLADQAKALFIAEKRAALARRLDEIGPVYQAPRHTQSGQRPH